MAKTKNRLLMLMKIDIEDYMPSRGKKKNLLQDLIGSPQECFLIYLTVEFRCPFAAESTRKCHQAEFKPESSKETHKGLPSTLTIRPF